MSKAVLVIDMPESCDNCPYADLIMGDCEAFSVLKRTYTYELPDENEKRPEYCPLKPLPEMRERVPVSFDYDGGFSHGIVHGHNEVIMKLLEDVDE